MNLLLLEDEMAHRQELEIMIKDINEAISVTAVTSIRDLVRRLCTDVFDIAILDFDLREWSPANNPPLYARPEILKDGSDVARIIRNCNSKMVKTNVLVYSGYNPNEAVISGYHFMKKEFRPEMRFDLQKELKKIAARPQEFRPTPTPEKLRDFTRPEKARYYKELLARMNTHERFSYTGDHAWVSDLAAGNDKSLIGPMLKNNTPQYPNRPFLMTALVQVCNYQELKEVLQKEQVIQNIFWNYRVPAFFEEQYDDYRVMRNRHQDLDLFFNICYSDAMADHLLGVGAAGNAGDSALSVLAGTEDEIITGTEQSLIRKMAKKGSGEAEIQEMIGKVSKRTGYEVLDLLEGRLLEYNEATDIAEVSLRSLIDRENDLTREFSYKRLLLAGVEFVDSKFLYCVTEDKKKVGINATIEPL
jgi:hypothetical protein